MKTNTAELLKLNNNSNLDGSEPRQLSKLLNFGYDIHNFNSLQI